MRKYNMAIIILLFLPVLHYATLASSSSKKSPLAIMRQIYTTSEPQELMNLFQEHLEYLQQDAEAFRIILKEVYSHNDNVNLNDLEKNWKNGPTQKDRIKLSIRVVARTMLAMAEQKSGNQYLKSMHEGLHQLPKDWRGIYYFHRQAYNSMARSNPDMLMDLLKEDQVSNKGMVLVALLRKGRPVKQKVIESYLSRSGIGQELYPLTYYVTDSSYRVSYLNRQFEYYKNRKYNDKKFAMVELINAYAAFAEGRKELEKQKSQGHLDYIEQDGVYFGILKGSGIQRKQIESKKKLFKKIATYLHKVNRTFNDKESILFVEIQSRGANWGECSLRIGSDELADPRSALFTLLHEACEQKYDKGYFSCEFGETYINAFSDNMELIHMMRLRQRIGGTSLSSDKGHPWDSEREWLAEVGSAVVIGEKLDRKINPAIEAFRTIPGVTVNN